MSLFANLSPTQRRVYSYKRQIAALDRRNGQIQEAMQYVVARTERLIGNAYDYWLKLIVVGQEAMQGERQPRSFRIVIPIDATERAYRSALLALSARS